MADLITTNDIAKRAQISDQTVRRYFATDPRFAKRDPRSWRRFDSSELESLVAFCNAQKKRKRLNRFNAVPVDVPFEAAPASRRAD